MRKFMTLSAIALSIAAMVSTANAHGFGGSSHGGYGGFSHGGYGGFHHGFAGFHYGRFGGWHREFGFHHRRFYGGQDQDPCLVYYNDPEAYGQCEQGS